MPAACCLRRSSLAAALASALNAWPRCMVAGEDLDRADGANAPPISGVGRNAAALDRRRRREAALMID